jgi:high-affinity nickel permease
MAEESRAQTLPMVTPLALPCLFTRGESLTPFDDANISLRSATVLAFVTPAAHSEHAHVPERQPQSRI